MKYVILIIAFISFYSIKAQDYPTGDSLIQRLEGTWQVKYAYTLNDTCRSFLTIHFETDTSGSWLYSNCIYSNNPKRKQFELTYDEGIRFQFVKDDGSYLFRLYQRNHVIKSKVQGYQDVKLGNLGFNTMRLYPVELIKKLKQPEPVYTKNKAPINNNDYIKISGGHLGNKIWRKGKYIDL